MSTLTHQERIGLEQYLGMQSGYLCNFSDRSFRDFVLLATGIDVYSDAYNAQGTSKAKRLRTFWINESDCDNGKLLNALLDYWKAEKSKWEEGFTENDQAFHDAGKLTARRLLGISDIKNIGAIAPISGEPEFTLLCTEIRNAIDRGQPNLVLDRLHTYAIRWLRNICRKRGIEFDREVPLHGLFKRYSHYLKANVPEILESEMAARTMNQVSSILDAYNTARNTRTFAHDNPLLSNRESILVINIMTAIITFLNDIEAELDGDGG
jgi:hypothetical protein